MSALTNLCRCCLSPDAEVSLIDSEQNLREKFLEITTVEVNTDDGLPQALCSGCFETMNSAYQFRTQCIKMDNELKVQVEAYLKQVAEENEENEVEDALQENEENDDDDDDIANNPLRQLQEIIKTEPNDGEDDYYYVLVIDDPKDKDKKEINKPEEPVQVKIEKNDADSPENPALVSNEDSQTSQISQTQSKPEVINFESSIDAFLVSDTRVPDNVPATILENEEESQDADMEEENIMQVDDSQDSNSQGLIQNEDSQDKEVQDYVETLTNNLNDSLPSANSFIKILTTTNADGNIVLKADDNNIQYFTNAQLIGNDDGEDGNQEEVILCEGDETSQFQIFKYDGSELVIEYADDGQIATVLQQDDGSYLCECGESFEDLGDYESHQYLHNPSGVNLCNLCGKAFESVEILAGHKMLHNNTSPILKCLFCPLLVKRSAMTQHIKYTHHNQSKPRCSICSKTFANPNNLKRHKVIHSGVKEFECDICFKRFHQKITMQTHRLTHVKPFTCVQCDKSFEDLAALNSHRDSNTCNQSKVTKVKDELMKTIKKEIRTNLGKHLGYACTLCHKMFSVESALEQHIESTHMVLPNELLCSECGEVMPTKKDMNSHILSHKAMKNKNIKRFECSTCGKGCASQAMLITHERVHTNERPFPCGLCTLKFKTKTHLRTHQLTHTREKKFGCSVCMKFFALKGNLVVHLRTHTGERPYVCHCGEAFIDSKYLKKHKLKKHAMDKGWTYQG